MINQESCSDSGIPETVTGDDNSNRMVKGRRRPRFVYFQRAMSRFDPKPVRPRSGP